MTSIPDHKKCIVSLFTCLIFIQIAYGYINCDTIVKFSETKFIKKGVIFGCFKSGESILLSKCLNKDYLQFIIIDLNDYSNYFQNGLMRKYNHWGVIVDGDCKNMTKILNKKTNKKYFYETYHWLITSSSLTITKNLSDLKLNINCDVHLLIYNSTVYDKNVTFAIYDVYNPAYKHGGELKIEIIGFYQKNEGYVIENHENKYWRRKNMTGVNLKSAVVNASGNNWRTLYLCLQGRAHGHFKILLKEKFTELKVPTLEIPLQEYLDSDENRQIDSMHRFQANTINHCKDIYNFSLDIQRTRSWGYIQANGKFDGLVSLLEKREVDFGSSPLLFKLDRMPFVDYGYGNWILRSSFIYRKPKVTAMSYEIFLRPLETEVWIVILVILCFVLIILKIVFSSESKALNKKDFGVDDTTWSFLVLFTLGAFCQQGAVCYPKLLSSRILAFFVFLFCILVYQFYSASIVSYLLLDPPRTIFNLKDLKESSLRVGIEDILIDRNYFVQTTDPDAIQLFEMKIKNSNNNSGFYSPKEGLELVRQGGFAFHVETSTAYPIIEETFSNQVICELEEVQMYRTQPMFTNLQKNSPFKEMLNYCMFKLAENGNLDRLRKHWDARRPKCIEAAKKQELSVSFNEFSCGPFAVTIGTLLSTIFFVVEYFLYNKEKLVRSFKFNAKNRHKMYPFTN